MQHEDFATKGLFTWSYLRDLIESFHIFLKMLEKYCSGKSHIIVQKKKKITKKKKRTAPAATPANWTPEETEQKWQDLASDLSAVLQGHAGDIPESIVPFDAASEIPVDEQKTHALSQIQGFLRNQQCADAVALLRAARDVWADDEQFGSAGISAEDEFICLNNIFKMDLPPVNTANENDDEEEQEEETIPEEEEMAAVQPRETEFSIQEFLNKLATPSVIQPYCWLLKFYKENKEVTNHAIIKMLHRVAIDLKTPSMLFQLSLFGTFHTILSDPSANQYKEMAKFTRYIVAKFFEKLPKNSVLLAELVIWKSTKDCYEIEEGYGSLEFRSASTNAAVWTFEEEEELRQLYDEYKGSDDLVDTIMEKMSSDTKNRRQIIKKLVAMKLVTNRKELHKRYSLGHKCYIKDGNLLLCPPSVLMFVGSNAKPTGKRNIEWEEEEGKAVKKGAWSEEETEQLRALFDEYKNSEEDIVEKIMEHMLNPSKTRRQVINQLVNMGIVEDRKMLRKKRKKGERKRKKSNDDGFVVDDDNEDEESEGGHSDLEEGFDHQPSSSNGESEEEEQDSGDSDDTLTHIISKLKSEGLGEQLKWIQSKLQRIADDRQNTDNKTWQPLPLVTITEENEEALSNKLFKKALKKVGLKPPANEQETFWRIPVALNSDKLRKAVEDLNGKDTGENEEGNGAVPSPVNDKSKSRKETLAALAAARKKNGSASTRKRKERITKRASGRAWRKSLKETTTESDGENHSDRESCDGVSDVKNATPPLSGDQNSTSKKRSKRRVKRLDDSDEDELGEENLLEQRQEGLGNGYLESDDERTSNALVKADSVRSDIEEDNLEYSTNISDSEDISNNTETSKSEAGKKRPRIESDDSDSDDDDEFNLPLSYHKRARRVLVDDNDDNE